ncbi:MAG: 6-carboxytetrahydropterin synthase [Planctomycetota bacterium]
MPASGTIRLTRTTRFCINDPAFGDAADQLRSDPNGFAAKPSMRGLGRYYSVDVTAEGAPDPQTGYLIDIKGIDNAVRRAVVPLLEDACRQRPADEPATLMPGLVDALAAALPVGLHELRFNPTPYYSIAMTTTQPAVVTLRQRFDFAAAHRLHVDGLSDAENEQMFGKCNNPSGHGHNYQVEPAVEVPVPSGGAMALTLADLERVTQSVVVDRFDHTNLNIDPPDFGPAGVNPTVEHIARVCYELLDAALRERHPEARLASVTVWETDRTSCTYPAGG